MTRRQMRPRPNAARPNVARTTAEGPQCDARRRLTVTCGVTGRRFATFVAASTPTCLAADRPTCGDRRARRALPPWRCAMASAIAELD